MTSQPLARRTFARLAAANFEPDVSRVDLFHAINITTSMATNP